MSMTAAPAESIAYQPSQLAPDPGYRKSFLKMTFVASSVVVATVLFELIVGFVYFTHSAQIPAILTAAFIIVGVAILPLLTWAALVATGGIIALRRDALEAVGRPYAARGPREASPRGVGALVRAVLRIGSADGSLQLRPGEPVVVRSLDEILATLDEQGTLDGLPFTPEMFAFCGTRTTVFRRVDKLNDWIRHTGLRRVRRIVQLDGSRCSGAAHGGCQANCHLRWHEAWLRRANDTRSTAANGGVNRGLSEADVRRLAERSSPEGELRYMCQATELVAGTEPISWSGPGHFIRDLTTGNIRLKPWMTGVSIAFFNWIQKKRGGVTFPYMAPSVSKASPTEILGLKAGELVRVKTKDRIAETLNDRNRNRGLWFDREMLRFCGGEFRVESVLERVIIESTGALREPSNPCIVLEGVKASGEYLGFNPEDEHIFWREIWLERVTAPPKK